VYGSTVVSVLKGFPSTLPARIADGSSLIGKSGFATFVGSENIGVARSTRSLSGVSGSSSSPAAASCARVACGMVAGSELRELPQPTVRVAATAASTSIGLTVMACLLGRVPQEAP
jgi:hypothetical protein